MRLASVLALGFALAGSACGARTGLDAGDEPGGGGRGPTRTYARIGILGNAGPYDALALLDFLATRGTVTRTQTDAALLTDGALAAFDLVIIDQLVREYSGDEARVFERWVAAGGGVVSLTGYQNSEPDTTRPNSLLAELGVGYQQPLLSTDFNGSVTSFAVHPLTRGLFAVVFMGGYEVTHDAPATEIAFDRGVTVAVAREHGLGRVYVWGDEWVEYSQEWDSPQPKRFWSDALTWLSHQE